MYSKNSLRVCLQVYGLRFAFVCRCYLQNLASFVLVATRSVCVCVVPASSESGEMQPALMLSLNKSRCERCDFELLGTAVVGDISGIGGEGGSGLKNEVSNKCACKIVGFRLL